MSNWSIPYKAIRWGADFSHWNTIDLAQLIDMKNHGLSFVWIQMIHGLREEGKFRYYVDLCRQLKIPYGPYTWFYPQNDPIAQADAGVAMQKLLASDASCIMGDFEQDHVDESNATSAWISTDVIYNSVTKYINRVVSQTNLPFVFYSGPGYMNRVYALKPLLAKYSYVNASYWTNAEQRMTWDGFANYLTKINRATIPTNVAQNDVDAHQFATNILIQKPNGFYYEPVDFDAFQEEDAYQRVFSKGSIIPPVIIPPIVIIDKHKVTASVLTVREKPNSFVETPLGYVKMGDILKVENISGNWGYVDCIQATTPSFTGHGWVNLSYTVKI